ncbi:MAG: hypothetical protein ACRD92_05930 [Nitrosopumilaceae archaeon]
MEAIPDASTQDLYDGHDVILLGKVISKNSTFSPTQFLYEIKVEKYLKNPQPNDVIIAAGLNSFNSRLGNAVFEIGDSGLFFLDNYSQKYDSNQSPLSISLRSIKVPLESSEDEQIMSSIEAIQRYSSEHAGSGSPLLAWDANQAFFLIIIPAIIFGSLATTIFLKSKVRKWKKQS